MRRTIVAIATGLVAATMALAGCSSNSIQMTCSVANGYSITNNSGQELNDAWANVEFYAANGTNLGIYQEILPDTAIGLPSGYTISNMGFTDGPGNEAATCKVLYLT